MKNKQETQQMALKWAKEIKAQHPQTNKLLVTFDGSGDSGDITEIVAFDKKDRWKSEVSLDFAGVPDFLYDLIAHHVTCDWVNNDGGGGSITIDLTDFTMNVSSFYREVTDCDLDDINLNLTNEPSL